MKINLKQKKSLTLKSKHNGQSILKTPDFMSSHRKVLFTYEPCKKHHLSNTQLNEKKNA